MKDNKIHNAIIYAAMQHKGQVRKGTDIPYIVHPMEVMQILTAAGGDEDMIVAGEFHDKLGDTDAPIDAIKRLFGDRVAELVARESEDKPNPWRERKESTTRHLRDCSDEEAICTLADKLSNARSIVADYARVGDILWERFNNDKASELWYYSEIARATERLSATKIWQEYSECVAAMHDIIGG